MSRDTRLINFFSKHDLLQSFEVIGLPRVSFITSLFSFLFLSLFYVYPILHLSMSKMHARTKHGHIHVYGFLHA